MNEEAKQQKKIAVYKSIFENLNYGQVMYSLARIAPGKANSQYLHQSKGHIFTIYEYSGPIELVNNTISKNMAFIPSAILSNHEKFNKTLLNFDNDFFKTEDE